MSHLVTAVFQCPHNRPSASVASTFGDAGYHQHSSQSFPKTQITLISAQDSPVDSHATQVSQGGLSDDIPGLKGLSSTITCCRSGLTSYDSPHSSHSSFLPVPQIEQGVFQPRAFALALCFPPDVPITSSFTSLRTFPQSYILSAVFLGHAN